METILTTLERLSEAAYEALPLLEKYDYRKEADAGEILDLKLIPRHLKEIIRSLAMFYSPVTFNGERLPDDELLDNDNLQIFIENLQISGDRNALRRFSRIDLEPIKEVAAHLQALGHANHAKILDNIYSFASEFRSNGRIHSFRPATADETPIQINFTLAPDELTEDQLKDAQLYKEFNGIFRSGALYPAQKRAIYDAFRSILADETVAKPHLVIIAAICLMMNQRSYGRPLSGTFNHIRETVFISLGKSAATGKSYRENSLKPDVTPSLLSYKKQAADLLQTALGNTR